MANPEWTDPEDWEGRPAETSEQTIFMARAEIAGIHPPQDFWFRERAVMDDFLAARPAGLTITDIHERGTYATAAEALESAAELVEEGLAELAA